MQRESGERGESGEREEKAEKANDPKVKGDSVGKEEKERKKGGKYDKNTEES